VFGVWVAVVYHLGVLLYHFCGCEDGAGDELGERGGDAVDYGLGEDWGATAGWVVFCQACFYAFVGGEECSC